MNIDLKNSIIIACISAVFGASGYFVTKYFESEEKKTEYRLKINEKLYNKFSNNIELIKEAESLVISTLNNDYALTRYELKKPVEEFNVATKEYEKYLDELKRYGTTEQIEAVKQLLDWIYSIRAELFLQQKISEQVENTAVRILLTEEKNEQVLEMLNNALNEDITRLIKNENRIYYTIGWYQKPIIRSFEQYINFQFRRNIGLEPTLDMVTAINSLEKLIENKNNFSYKDKTFPFSIASGRYMFAPELELKDAGDLISIKENNLKELVKLTFLSKISKENKLINNNKKANKSSQSNSKLSLK